jgi:secreted trypsin-like serine protease
MRFLIAAVVALLSAPAADAQAVLQQYKGSGGASSDDIQKLNGILKGLSVQDATKEKLNLELYLDPRIIGGSPADIKDAPWQVALVFGKYKDPFRAQFCGGSVISNDWVVTAAHCVVNDSVNRTAANVAIVANTTFYNTGGDRIDVTEIRVHEKYDPQSNDYDIALLKLASHPARLTPVGLPNSGDALPAGTNMIVTGWGALREGSPGTAYLISANIPVISNQTCNEAVSYNGAITDNMICAGLRSGGLDSCQGDSGGPAVALSGDAKLLVGIVSFGEGCARRDKYGVYTNVRIFRPWIDQQM